MTNEIKFGGRGYRLSSNYWRISKSPILSSYFIHIHQISLIFYHDVSCERVVIVSETWVTSHKYGWNKRIILVNWIFQFDESLVTHKNIEKFIYFYFSPQFCDTKSLLLFWMERYNSFSLFCFLLTMNHQHPLTRNISWWGCKIFFWEKYPHEYIKEILRRE